LANEWLKKHRTQKQIDDAKKLEVDYLNESIKFCKEELEQIEEEQNNLIAEFDRNKIELRSQFQEENIRVERESIEGLLDDSLENELQNNRDWLAEELSTSSSIFKEDKSELTARRRQCEESLIRYKEKLNEMERDLN